MSNPYEQILRKAAPRPPKDEKDSRPASAPSSVLSKVAKKRQIPKPPIRFNLRPRFRFDLPDPPMDPKMLLGRLSTASYAKPYISALEKDFRSTAIPADPTHGLRANLVESALYMQPASLSVDDDALLLSVMAGRPGYAGAKGVADGGRRATQKVGMLPPPRPAATSTAPWMRRMSYDEYLGGSSNVTRHKISVKEEKEAAEKFANDRKNDPKMRERRRRQMLHSFEAARRHPVHPDKRKSHLTPVHIAPILPDFFLLGEKFIALEFDKDDTLAGRDRTEGDREAADESVRSLVTLPVADAKSTKSGKKLIACYAPNDDTLKKRKRVREENDGPMDSDRERKKACFVADEAYEWIGEYAVREGKLGSSGVDGVPSRSSFAVSERVSDDSKTRVAFLSRIGTSWKLSKRPGTEQRLGKEGLNLRRDVDSTADERADERAQHDLIAGVLKTKSEPKDVKVEASIERAVRY